MARRKGIEAGEGYYILKDFGAVVEFTGGKSRDILYAEAASAGGADFKPAKWGADNLQPQKMLQLVAENHIKPQLIETGRDFLLGSRLGIFRRVIDTDTQTGHKKLRIEPEFNPDIEDWLEYIDSDNYLRSAAYNLEYSGNTFTSFSLASKTEIDQIRSWDFLNVRARQMEGKQSRPSHYYLHPDWARVKASEVTILPAYDRRDPTRFGDFMYHGRDWIPGQPYYNWAAWWGTQSWTVVSNLIPKFHAAGLKNGYNIKYHIKIPIDYFNQYKEPAEKLAAEQNLMQTMNEMLSGVENADKAFVSKFGTDQFGKPMAGWSIEPIENKMSDDAYSNVNNQSNIAHTSGHGIDPSLAGIDTGGKLGGSGSEKRISYQLHIALRTPNKRKILLEPFNVAKKIMGWDRDVFIGLEETDITTIEENPNGKQKVTNQNQ